MAEFNSWDDDGEVYEQDEEMAPVRDIGKVWAWVCKLKKRPDRITRHTHETEKCKYSIGLVEEGEEYGLHVGGLSCYGNNSRKLGALKDAQKLFEPGSENPFGFSGTVGYCNLAVNSGKDWMRHNFKGDRQARDRVIEEARERGWNLYWMRIQEEDGESMPKGKMKMSDNMRLVHAWFNDYRAERGDSKPGYERFKDVLYERFGPSVAYLERCTRAMYDNWKPSVKHNWLLERLAKEPDDSPLVKHARIDIDYERTAAALCDWTDTWLVYSEQNDFRMKDCVDVRCYKLYAVMMCLLTRTAPRTNAIKTHGMWICGPKGMGKSLLTEFASGIFERRKKVAGDAAGVGRFKCNSFQDVIIVDDIKCDIYKQRDYYQTINQLLDNTGTEVKIHSSTALLVNKYVILNSNEEMIGLDREDTDDETDGRVQVMKYTHPLRRRVLEIRIREPLKRFAINQIVKINNDSDYREEGDRLMWRWWIDMSRRHRFKNGCADRNLIRMQEMLDEQYRDEYETDGGRKNDDESDDEQPLCKYLKKN